MERFNIRFNSDIVIASKFTTSFDVSYSNITRELRDDGWAPNYATVAIASPSVLSLIKSPFVSPYDFSNTENPVQTDFIADADDYLAEVLSSDGSLANPTAILANGKAVNKNSFDNTMINIAVTPKWHATKNFSLQERFSFTMHSLDESYFTPIIGMPNFTLAEVGEIENTKASLYYKHSSAFSDTRFDWAIPLGAHRIDMFGGARFMSDTSTSSQLRGYNTGNDKTSIAVVLQDWIRAGTHLHTISTSTTTTRRSTTYRGRLQPKHLHASVRIQRQVSACSVFVGVSSHQFRVHG